MPHAIIIEKNGGPEVLSWKEVQVGSPGPGQVRLRQTAVGLNFIDVYHRTGLYPLPLPSGIGQEGAGIVEEVGSGVTHLKPGDRVAYAGAPIGSYAEARLYPADRLVVLPQGVDEKTAAAMMLQGMTVRYLLRQTHALKAGETVVLHAAAGGIGLIFCQWAKAIGANVIGTVSTPEKAEIAKAHGCTHVVVSGKDDLVATVKDVTGGKGVPVVYDSVGKDTWTQSLDSLMPRGLMVSFGNASGAVPAFEVGLLAQKGSLFLTRPTLVHYTATWDALQESAADLFAQVTSGAVRILVNQTYALKDAAQAHRDLEARKTTGSTVLLP